MAKNCWDLARNIPEKNKRLIRQRCGFGCIKCGSAYYHYDHLGVEFKDAKEHDPEKIVLLCGACHDLKTRRALSTETVERLAKAPYCKKKEFSWGPLDIGTDPPEVSIGNIRATNVRSLITIDGESIFSISPPEEEGAPFTISASLHDKNGRQTLRIVNNEFQVAVGNWDTVIEGQKLTIRSALRCFDLVMRVDPPRRIVIERLDMTYKNLSIKCQEGKETVIEGPSLHLATNGAVLTGHDIAICVEGNSFAIGSGRGGRTYIEHMVVNPFGPVGAAGTIELGWAPPVKQGRNEKCLCNSGKKHKHCHGKLY